ncbi:MAG: multicopper oxidase domain-containing protein [Gemmatimonadota bacterium]
MPLRLGPLALVLSLATLAAGLPARRTDARVVANDNRVPAGVLHADTLRISLVLQQAEWYPEAEDGPHVTVEAFGEAGKVPNIPAPLIRVRAGTVVRATVRNALSDSTAHILGLGRHPIAVTDTLHVAPGDSVTVTFLAGEPGTYQYRARIGNPTEKRGNAEHTTAGGAFIVDPVGGSPPDRIFVLNIINYDIDSTHFKEALGINGKSWPYTERVAMTVGDSLHWRIVNSTIRGHPMHLHGFYFRTTAKGNGLTTRVIPPAQQELEVTDSYAPWGTRDISWSPDRPGNWLFHCHLSYHVIPDARLDKDPADDHQTHSPDPMVHMAGLVVGLSVAPKPGTAEPAPGKPRQLELYFQQGGPRGRMHATFSYILQRGATPPAVDSVEIPGSPLLLTRGIPVDVRVHNRTLQPGGVHWHGVELLSWSDGVVGWSSKGTALAPPILPGETFTAHLLLPRAGTFIYHTHMNDIEQVTGGAAGAIVVTEPGAPFNPARDHIYTTLWHGETANQGLLINGDSTTSPVLVLAPGVTHRFRFINIGPAGIVSYTLRRDTTVTTWQRRAKDGADLPLPLRTMVPARFSLDVGETIDFEFNAPREPGHYELAAGFKGAPIAWRQEIVVQ